ncbi:hypothetical protein H696_04875 [Fonticula alba]|uniref:Uncharacterized protein n=1 Tax=Fonticula alba TaxID=691883 RepID=A0A058Z3U7_FONAL|nr:hypothetical protein H696_04875 [Fonticula alba]KCV68583.1 hypothetical protein H696_04875 [Fonticula alba]|eukprot:XP_009497015.1 hypothetical protein H696_04875 [Fonticula alba]
MSVASEKRPAAAMDESPSSQTLAVVQQTKRAKESTDTQLAKVAPKVRRTSRLSDPVVTLVDAHPKGASINAVRVSPCGEVLASGGDDGSIQLWKFFPPMENHAALKGHSHAIRDLAFAASGTRNNPGALYSASADQSVAVWDTATAQRVRRWRHRTGVINTIAAAPAGTSFASAGDDGQLKIFDVREKRATHSVSHGHPLTSLAWAPSFSYGADISAGVTGADEHLIFVGGVDNLIRAYDMRTIVSSQAADTPANALFILRGHRDTVTGLRRSPCGRRLASNAADSTVRVWDSRSFVTGAAAAAAAAPEEGAVPLDPRLRATLNGAPHAATLPHLLPRVAWSPTGSHLAAGSPAERSVCVWDVSSVPLGAGGGGSAQLVYKLPGHQGAVTDVDWARGGASESDGPSAEGVGILASSGLDGVVFVGEV